MIVTRYVALGLLLAVSTVLLGAVVSQPSNGARLFVRCLRWGLATGSVTGAVFGAALPLIESLRGDPGLLLVWVLGGVVSGAILGAIVSVIPTLLGGVFVTALLRHRHRHPSSEESVQRDLTAAFGVVVAVLDVILFVTLIANGALSPAAIAVPLIVVGNACVVLMLRRARRSISRLWLAIAG